MTKTPDREKKWCTNTDLGLYARKLREEVCYLKEAIQVKKKAKHTSEITPRR